MTIIMVELKGDSYLRKGWAAIDSLTRQAEIAWDTDPDARLMIVFFSWEKRAPVVTLEAVKGGPWIARGADGTTAVWRDVEMPVFMPPLRNAEIPALMPEPAPALWHSPAECIEFDCPQCDSSRKAA